MTDHAVDAAVDEIGQLVNAIDAQAAGEVRADLPVPVETQTTPPTLAQMNAVAASHVAAVIDIIADRCLSPSREPGDLWAGKDEVIEWAMATLKVPEDQAVAIVHEAQLQLWALDRKDDSHVQRQLSLSRMRQLRRMIQENMTKPQTVTKWKFEETKKVNADGLPILARRKAEEKVIEGFNSQVARLAVLVEGVIDMITSKSSKAGEQSTQQLIQNFTRVDVLAVKTKEGEEVRMRERKVASMEGLTDEAMAELSRHVEGELVEDEE